MDHLLQRTAQCPPPEAIAKLALGEATASWLGHVSQCDYCSSLLRNAMEDLTREASPEEEALAAGIAPPKRAPSRPPRWWPFAAVAALLLMFGAGAYRYTLAARDPSRIAGLVALAYASNRSLDVRLSGVKYGPMRVERSSPSQAKFAATAMQLAEAIDRSPADFRLLQAKGQLALLEGHEQAAIEVLRAAIALKASDPSLTIDLAAALFQSSRRNGNVSALEEALTLLTDVLRRNPDETVALFNFGIILGERQRLDEASETWEHFLRVETSPDWRNEAQSRLDRIRDAAGKPAPR